MKFKDLKNNIISAVSKAGFELNKKSPEILIVSGVIGAVASTILACRATLKVNDILTNTRDSVDKIHELSESSELGEKLFDKDGKPVEYTEEDSKKDLTVVYAKTAVEFVKLYAPSVILGAISVGMICTSNSIMRKRNMALATAYATIDRTFKNYRKRVADKYGEEAEHDIRYNVKSEVSEEPVLDKNGNPTGKTKAVEKKVSKYDGFSEYARFFDETCPAFERDAFTNKMFLISREGYANDLLRSRGYLFLNEVYHLLEIPETVAGQVVGWVYDPKNKEYDNRVDFGLYNTARKETVDFMNGYNNSILLDFNVDGPILNRVKLESI